MPWAEVLTNVPGFNIGVGQGPDAGQHGGAILSFVVEDIAAARRQLEAKGVAFDGDIMDTPGVVRLTDFHDPDGNRYMLAEVPS
jgi:predicted enzyme related to lactoylglutathione lyase